MNRKNILLTVTVGLLTLCHTPLSHAQTAARLRIIATTDVHGNYFPHDFITGRDGDGSLSRIYKYVCSEREKYGAENLLLLDAGDILQGQPPAYYYNFIDTVSTHACASVLNFMGYDALAIGNHDVETGHEVYDRWVAQCRFPVLGANVTDTATGKPYWKPYTIVEKAGHRVAVFGLLTPTIPRWLPETLWSGMTFQDMLETAQQYMPEMRSKADIVVGLFHSGAGTLPEGEFPRNAENASLAVAQQVPGFDIVFCGHDHRRADTFVVTAQGDTVRVLNAGPDAGYVSSATIYFNADGSRHAVSGSVIDIRALDPDASFMHHFADEINAVGNFTQQVIGKNRRQISTRPAYFGPSQFIDFIHRMQLKISGADISFAAPLSFDGTIERGDVKVGDMFTLYRYENRLYVMILSGQEIKDYLEFSYAGWTRQMSDADDIMLNFIEPEPSGIGKGEGWKRLAVPSYNFDSAAGLRYTVDLTKPAGQKINIISMADGSEFRPEKKYRVALNSYRGNGGGGHLTKGARIPKEQLQSRITWTTDKDLRYYLMQEIRREGGIKARALNQWEFIPRKFVKKARLRDGMHLFE